MKFALVMPPATLSDAAMAQRILATAMMMQSDGSHEVALHVPCQPPGLAAYVSHIARDTSVRLGFHPYALPPCGDDDNDDSHNARSLIWTRYLQEQDADIIIVFHDTRMGHLRCLSRLPHSLLAYVPMAHAEPGTDRAERGVSPQIVVATAVAVERMCALWNERCFSVVELNPDDTAPTLQLPAMLPAAATDGPAMADTAHDTGTDALALFGPTVLAQLSRQGTALLQARKVKGAAPPANGHAYRNMVESLRQLRQPTPDLVEFVNAIAFNEGPGQHRQLLLDISVIVHGDAHSGIQRVVRSLLMELLRSSPADVDVRPIHFLTGGYLYANAYAHKLTRAGALPESDTHVDFRPGDMYLALDLNTHLVEPARNAFLDMQARGVSLNFVVYDILLVHHPEWWKPGLSEGFEKWLRSIGTLADTLVCISDAVANDVREWIAKERLHRYGGPQIASFHLGADVASSLPSTGIPAAAPATLAALRATPSFLMVGTIEPRKGHAQALAAFELLWSQGHDCKLVVVGKAGWLVDELVTHMKSHAEFGRRLVWLEGISDEFLEAVYQASACLLAASLGEGFGLPLIEAAQHGLPLIVRDMPVFREVAGDHALYFEGTSPDALAVAVLDWVARSGAGQAPDSRRIRILTWKESALQLQTALGLRPETAQEAWRLPQMPGQGAVSPGA